ERVAVDGTVAAEATRNGHSCSARSATVLRAMHRHTIISFLLVVGCSSSRDTASPGGDTSPPGEDGGGPVCLAAESPCSTASECCDDLFCDQNSLGKVCCGGIGASCNTPNGTDCCGPLECTDGVCGGRWDPSTPALKLFPVRGMHNLGYEAPSTGNTS